MVSGGGKRPGPVSGSVVTLASERRLWKCFSGFGGFSPDGGAGELSE